MEQQIRGDEEKDRVCGEMAFWAVLIRSASDAAGHTGNVFIRFFLRTRERAARKAPNQLGYYYF